MLAIAGGVTNGMAFGWQAGLAAGMALAAQIIVAPSAAELPGLRRVFGVVYALASLGIAAYGVLLPHLPSLDQGWSSESALNAALWTGLLGTWVFNLLSWLPARKKR